MHHVLHLLLEQIGHRPNEPIDLAIALDVARRSHAETVVLGSFAALGGSVNITLQLHDAHTGRLQAAETLRVGAPEAILTQIDVFSQKLAPHLGVVIPLGEGNPAQVMTRNLDAYRYYSLLKRAAALESNEAAAHERLANSYRWAGLYKEAIDRYQLALSRNPNFDLAVLGLGAVSFDLGRYRDAKARLTRLLRLTN